MVMENPGRPNFQVPPPTTPSVAANPQSSATPFSTSGPLVGSGASISRPTGPGRPIGGVFQNFPSQQSYATPQAPPPRSLPVGQPIFHAPASQGSSATSFRPPLQGPSTAVALPPSTMPVPQPSLDSSLLTTRTSFPSSFPPTGSPYPAPRANVQPPLNSNTQLPPLQSHFQAQPGNFASSTPTQSLHFGPNQGGFVQPPTVGAALGLHPREQIQHQGSMPPTGGIQGLTEDFSSLSIGSAPGSTDPGVDKKLLPRPLDGDVEPNSLGEAYSMNCHSRYLRFTTTGIPNSQSLASRWHLPLGAVVCPLAEAPDGEEVPVINFLTTGVIRCKRCRTYINLFVTFTDAGRKWCCNACACLNDVPGDYFAHLDASGRRVDLDQRPELTKGSVEFVAPAEYMVRPPMPPIYFFLIDVSIAAIRTGMIGVVAQTIKSCLADLAGFPRTQIGFITFDSTIHFYSMKSSLTQPQMMVVSDLEDIFIPLPDDLLVNLSESRGVVEAFLDALPSMFQDTMNLESAFGPALKATSMIMSPLGGKLLIFQSAMPSLGSGRLKIRGDDFRVYGTDKEYTLRVPEDPFYKYMAAEFTQHHIGVDFYVFSDKYTDIASLGALAKYTGGKLYYYQSFQSAIHGEKLRHELTRNLTRETAWEAVMRVRCGKGIRFTSYHGNFMLRSSDLISLPAVDCDKAYAMQLQLEETLLTNRTVYFQVALLYTASCGERRIRVHTAAAPVVADLGDMYRLADDGAIVSLLARIAIDKTLTSKLEDARNHVQLRIVKALKEYRNLFQVQHRLGGTMIYPESLKFLSLYGLALCKSTALRGGHTDVQLDERCAAGFTVMALPIKKLLKLLYPSLIRVDDYLLKPSAKIDDFKNIEHLPLTKESLDSRGLYLYDDGFHFIIWFGRMVPPDLEMNLLGPDAAAELSKVILIEQTTEMSRKLIGMLDRIRKSDPSYYQLSHLVRQGEQPREGFLLLTNLVEDQIGGTNGYIDWLVQLSRQVQQTA